MSFWKDAFTDLAAKGRERAIEQYEDKAAAEEAKAGKTLRRSKPHVRKARAARTKAERLRKQGS
jgi:quinol monooxygenase YgiN